MHDSNNTKVSIWVGNAGSEHELNASLTFDYTEDGDLIPCEFCNAFGIDRFDDDFREASVSDAATQSARQLLAGHSYDTNIADALGAAASLPEPCNAIVLLYAFEYDGRVSSAQLHDATLHFLGCVEV